MVRTEAEISVCVGGFSVEFGGQRRFHPHDQRTQKINFTLLFYLYSMCMVHLDFQ
jgi:hypothetical protein